MLISHALLSTNAFLLVDAINRRFKTRLLLEISGVYFFCPKLYAACLLNCLAFLGFPGSIAFVAEFLFFSFFFDFLPACCALLVVILYFFVPVFFFRSWFAVLFGASKNFLGCTPVDLTAKEVLIHGGISFLIF